MKNNKMDKTIFPLMVITIAALIGCSSVKKVATPTPQQETQNNAINNNIGAENEATWFTELSFRKGSAKLNREDFKELNELVKKSVDIGSINEIKIISWADQEYPNKNAKSLSSGQESLADRRNEHIKGYLKKTYPSLNISVYNMAKRPNVFQELLKTSDDRTKKSIERAGITFDSDNRVNYAKKESTALVLSILK